jgi:hypothetical protein
MTLQRHSCALLIGSAVALVAAPALANSTHEVVSMKPVKQGAAVIGADFHVVLKPVGHRAARVGLGYAFKNANDHTPQHYVHVKDRSRGYMAADLETVQVSGPTERTFRVLYGKGNQLKAGDRVEVYSFWDERHLWGSNRGSIRTEPTFTLP